MPSNWDALGHDTAPALGGDDRTARQVQEVVEQLQKDFAERNKLYERIENTLHGTIPIKIPAAFADIAVPTRSPLPLQHKNTITAALSTNPPAVNVTPLGFGDTWETNASDREHFFDASWRRQELEARRPLFRLAMDALVTKGEFVLKTLERTRRAWSDYGSLSTKVLDELVDDAWQKKSTDDRRREYDARTERYKQRAPYPIATTDVLPETFYYLKTEDGFTFCCEVKRVPVLDTLARFAHGVGPGGRVVPQAMALPMNEWSRSMDGASTLTMIEAWTWKECFPAGTRVSFDSPVLTVTRRWHSGELAEVTTAGGKKLAGTPNHPVLTDRGWVGLGDLKKGDHVVRGSGLDQRSSGDEHDQDAQPTVEQVFNLANELGRSRAVAGGVHDFHGDGQDGEVDVVPVDRHLWNRINATLAQPVEQQDFTLADADHAGLLPAERGGAEGIGWRGSAPADGVGVGRQGSALVGAHPVLAEALRVGSGPQGGPATNQALVDRAHAPPVITGEDGAPFAGEVTTDEVVQVGRRPFAGHVYNFHTESNRYIANGIVVHNCYYILLGPGQELGGGSHVKTFRHGYGDPATKTLRGPYFHAQGITSHERLPHRAGLSLLYPFLDLYTLYDAVRTMRAVNAHRTAYAAYKDVGPPDGGLPGVGDPFGRDGSEDGRKALDIDPGRVIPGDIQPIEQPKAGVDFNLFAEELRRDLDLAVPSVLQGAVDTTESGWQLAQAVHLARLSWDPLVSNAQRALSERCGFESWLIEHRIGERVYVRGEVGRGDRSKSGYLAIGPEELNGLHDVYDVKLDPELPSTQVVELRYWGEAEKLGFASRADAITALGRNPDEVRRQRKLEQYQESDQVTARIFARVDQLLGQRAEAALQAAGLGQPPPTAPGAQLAGMGNPVVPGQAGQPLEPTPQTPGGPQPSAGVPTTGGTPPGAPGGIPADRLALAGGSGGMGP